jgi:1,2-diacylglycerol 3-alpha-glucosyltransferase
MNVLMLSDVYFPRVNGVSTSIQTFARELVARGHAVTIVAPAYGTDYDEPNVAIVRLPARTIFFDPEDRLIRASALEPALAALAATRWDVLHIHTPFRAHRLGIALARITGVPTVESYHTYFEQYAANYLPWLPASMLRFGVRWFSRRLCRDVDHLILPSKEMAAVIAAYGIATPHTIVPTGIRLDEFAGGDWPAFRAAHGISPDRPMILTVGRLAIEKNIDFLLDATRALLGEFPDLLFVIAGEGPDQERLQRRVEALTLTRNVRFIGNLRRDTDLLACYRATNAFVFASRTETQGLVLIEAMATGAPIVSTAVMGTATVLAGARSALVAEEDVDAFAAAIARLLRSPDERRRLSELGPLDAQRWSAPVLMDRVIELYRMLAAQGARAPAAARVTADAP